MSEICENYRRLMDRIGQASARSGRRPDSVRLIAVTKTVEPQRIAAAAECGVREIGENRVQEALGKREALRDFPLTWHLIGHLQTNKTKKATEYFDWIQSVDRPELARLLDQYASRRIPVLIEVKLVEEPRKSGVSESELSDLLEKIRACERLDVRGMMAIPPFFEDPEDVRPYFRKLKDLAVRYDLTEVSMGMSHDFEIAIEEGATMIRIGTALFGARP